VAVVNRDRVRSLGMVLLVVVGVAVVIGGILSAALFLGASGFGGVSQPEPAGPDPVATQTDPPTGTETPTPPGDTATEPSGTEPDTTEPAPTAEPTDEAADDPPSNGITLTANPTSVNAMDDISLQGTFDGADGTVLQVQRRLDGGDWEDFPVEATVRNGQFSTTVRSGRIGANEFRVRDDGGAVSNAVTVTVE